MLKIVLVILLLYPISSFCEPYSAPINSSVKIAEPAYKIVKEVNDKNPLGELETCDFSTLDSPNFGFTDNSVWTKLQFRNNDLKSAKFSLNIPHIYLSNFRLYRGTNCQNMDLISIHGLSEPQNPRVSTVGGYSIKLKVPAQTTTTYYIRARSKYPLNLPMFFSTLAETEVSRTRLSTALVFYIGFVLALALYNFLLFIVTREVSFLYYVLTIFGLHVFTNLAQFGVVKQYFFPNFLFFHSHSFHFAHVLSITTVFLFVTNFFGRSSLGRNYFVLRNLALISVPLAILGIYTNASLIDLVMQINTTIFSLYLLVWSGYLAFYIGARQAYLFFIAWSALIVSWVVNFLKIDGFISGLNFASYFILLAAALECVLLSLAIADRIRILTAERNRMKAELDLASEKSLIFRQVSHDIKSPLSALNAVLDLTAEISDNKKRVARLALSRIKDIANNLLSADTGTLNIPRDFSNDEKNPMLLSAIISDVVSEKRYQFASQLDLEIHYSMTIKNYPLFALGVSADLKRILSNLLNNSQEAIFGSGKILVSLGTVGDQHIINVSDTGSGISKDILSKIGYEGISYGKNKNRDSGTGLGLFHARTKIESWGGEFEIRSSEGSGTTVILSLPSTAPPSWFSDTIYLPRKGKVLIVDDDISVHNFWDSKLQEYQNWIKVLHAYNPDEALNLLRSESIDLTLIDLEFSGYSETGLDVATSIKVNSPFVISTNDFENPKLIMELNKKGFSILPKLILPFIKLSFFKSERLSASSYREL